MKTLTSRTKLAIDKEIDEMIKTDIYKWYRLFHLVPTDCREELAKYYVDEVEKKAHIAEKETPDLLQAFKRIRSGAGLAIEEEFFRSKDEFLFDDNDRIKKYGKKYKSYENELISKETYIQRNLFRNGMYYESELGTPLGYEIGLTRKKREFPVDLINYREKDGRLVFNLIELKAFRADGAIESPAKDMFLRAMFEVATYGAYFNAVMKHNDNLASKISDKLGNRFNIRQIKDADVELTVLAPDYIIKEKELEVIKPFMNYGIKLLTISPSERFSKDSKISSNEKMFIIK